MKTKSYSILESVNCILFLIFFVAPCVLHETLKSATLVSPIWLFVYAGISVLLVAMKLWKGTPNSVLLYCIAVSVCAFLTIGNGTSIGMMLLKIIYVYIGFVGFMMIRNKKMSLWPFDIAMIGLYFFFYKVYYRLLLAGQLLNLDEAFETSSSNAISICLVTCLFIYFLLNKYYNKGRGIVITFFAIINLVLIFLQGSRGGLIVALSQVLLCFWDLLHKTTKKTKKLLIIAIGGSVVAIVSSYWLLIMDSFNIDQFMHIFQSYDEEARAGLVKYAFSRMDSTKFLLGFSSSEKIDYDHRTYNAFIDYWLRYGLLPFLMLIFVTIRRVLLRKRFSIPLYYFIPLFLYTFAESYLTYGPWQYLLLVSLFLGEEKQGRRQLQTETQ